MIGKKMQVNETIQPNSWEIKKLKEVLPQYFNNKGEFAIDKFRDLLKQAEVDISKEGYELKFLGKSYAKYVSSMETETYISPDTEHNAKEENKDSENLYIVGDNIDALKHLLSSYAGKVKCIYIDPPYNTGSDGFVYPDSFQFNAEDLSQKIGITEDEAQRILDLAGKSTHSAWLTFIYPRLVLARDLLSEGGVIFISIDDNEQANLRLICDEIFGEENNLTKLIRKTKSMTGDDGNGLNIQHEYLYVISKSKTNAFFYGEEKELENYSNPDNDPNGIWTSADPSAKSGGETTYFPIENPFTGEVDYPPKGRFWAFSKNTMYEYIKNGRIKFRKEKKGRRRGFIFKRYAKNIESMNNPVNSLHFCGNDFMNSVATTELDELMTYSVFSYPKPVKYIRSLISCSTNKNDIILDFFSGSATTADAVMQLNAEDEGSRKYILVQIPEKIKEDKPAYQAGYRTIDQIGRARIEKAAEKIKEKLGGVIDYGYKLYYLETPEKKTLLDLVDFKPEIKFITDDMVSIFDNAHASGKESILATWLNEDGYGLTKSTTPYALERYQADLIASSLYIIDEGLEAEDVMALIKRIENEELDLTRVVVYVHSVTFNVLQELRKNLKVLRNNKNVTLIERF